MENMAKVSQDVAVVKETEGIETWLKDVGGRPLKLHDPVKVKKMIDDYFEVTAQNEWTVTGLCLALGIERATIINIEKRYPKRGGNEDVIKLVKQAREKVHNAYEIDLRNKNNAAGSIFALKNFGWSDQQQIDHTTGGQAFSVQVTDFATAREVQDAEYEEIDDSQND